MKQRFLILLLLLPILSFAQTNGSVKGLVSDSVHDYGLQSATVTVYKKADSSLVNYQVTNNQGEFNIGELPVRTPLLLSISYSGYNDFSKEVYLDSLKKDFDFKKILLSRDTSRQMEEVVVKAVVPVRMNGDTLEINPDAFKLDSSAVVEDMLLRVPGVTMWSDGTITVNGKKISNVFVDGKPFFGGNPEIATQNLPKTAIEKIQVYQEKDYSKQDISNTEMDSTFTMNIKMKPEKRKGFFGKIGAGLGTDQHYEGDMTMQAYNKKTKLAIAGNLNNTNKTIQDVREAIQNNTFRSYNRRNFGAPNANAGGLNTVHYFGASLQHNFDESTNSRFTNSAEGEYNLRDSRNNQLTNSTTIQNLTGYTITNISDRRNTGSSLNQSIDAGYENRKQATSFSTKANYSWNNGQSSSEGNTTAFRNDTVMASRRRNTSAATSHSSSFNLNGYFNNNDYDEGINKKSFSTNFSVSSNNSESNSNQTSRFESFLDSIYTQNTDRKYHNENSNFTTNIGMNYNGLRSLLFGNYNFWNINIGLRNNFRYNKSDLNANVLELDTLTNTYQVNEALTNINSVVNIEDRPGISFFKTISRTLSDRYYKSISFRTDLQNQFLYQKNTSTLSYRNLERSFHFFTPSSSVYYNYNRFNQYNLNIGLSHNSSANAPSIDQLYPIVDNINKYNIVVGNPDLKSPLSNNFNFNANYNTQRFNEKTTYTAGLNLGYNTFKNSISDSSIFGNNGSRTSYLLNIDGKRSFRGDVNASASFRINNKNMLQVRYNGGAGGSHAPQYITTKKQDGDFLTQLIYTQTRNQNHSIHVFYSLTDLFNISLGESINTNNSQQVGTGKAVLKAKTYGTNARFTLLVPKNFTLSTNVNYLNNISAQSQSEEATLWNAYATWRFMKMKQAEIKLSVFDILRQNRNITNFANDNNTTGTTITNGIQQFYMLTVSYFPRRFGGRTGRSGSRRSESGEQRQQRPQQQFRQQNNTQRGGGRR
ncbi:outer membrane beta-barrel protein [Niabella drilacis]|uniref:CarboxypepD_reg-like domain-containing protein n=1 Tax=Niabella drilacis (strain DSM 25811 / CCM 8410 / CCUG 62505 / LMG 26954 / E90) TaxID=1285928 RepID=A0A1G6Q9L6_NIADE|nr:outer membrane beta-barrel protein [Niabella drilacis]SDC89013.1 CarboxypepD_reg-like domain-containing protein [Niabella drilacis]